MIFYYNIFIYMYIAIYILYIIYIISYFLVLRVYIWLYIYIYIYILLYIILQYVYIYILYYAIEGFLKWGHPVAWKNRVYLGTSLRRAFSAMLTIKNLHNIFIVGRQDDEPKFTWNNLPSVSLIVSFLFLSPSCFPGRKVSL